MKKLSAVFNEVVTMDRVKGAVMGATAGYVLTGGQPVGAVLMGITGAFLGAEKLSETFNAVTMGRSLALEAVPALAKTAVKVLKR